MPDPGKGITNADDTTAIAQNPADLAFLPGPVVRWGVLWTGSASTVPARGTSFAAGLPIGPFATGLRLDLLYPPSAAPVPFSASYRWLRWALALGNEKASIGTTFGWGFSSLPALDGYASVTSGFTWRPFPSLSASFEARDWNEPSSKTGASIERSWVWGLGGRPFGSRVFEAAWDLAYYERSEVFGGHGMLALDVPRIGRIRGDFTMLPEPGRSFVATAGVEVNVDRFQALAGGVFGNAVTRSGTGFYAGAAFRSFREPGLRLPGRVARIRINDTPGVRGNTRLLRRLWRLADDPEVEGVILDLHAEPANSLAHAEEVADAVRLLRARGKKVMCHLEDNGGKALFVCSQADRISMNPAGGLRFSGLSSSYYYFGGLLKKLGVRADFVRIGAHKLAAEQLTLERGTDVAEADHQELVDQIESIYLHDIGGGRRLSAAELKKRIAKGPFIASEARAADLIDSLAYADEIDRWANEVMGHPVHVLDDNPSPRAPDHWSHEPKVALVYLHGDMVDGESKYIPFIDIKLAGSYTVARALKRAREDDSVKSVVFRVETGGGSSLAADVILREAILTAKKKPFIVSMGSAAASGGYYASVAGREIFASRATITGSIGIFYGKADLVGLLDKLGVRIEQFRSSPRADAESLFRPFTDDEKRELGAKVKQFYDLFVARVAEGRHMTPEAVDAVARGKVWTGQQAIGKGLVDKIGGLREALAEARRLGRLPADSPIAESPEEDDSLLGFLLDLVGFHVRARPARQRRIRADAVRAAPRRPSWSSSPTSRSRAPSSMRGGGGERPGRAVSDAPLLDASCSTRPCSDANRARIAIDGVTAIDRAHAHDDGRSRPRGRRRGAPRGAHRRAALGGRGRARVAAAAGGRSRRRRARRTSSRARCCSGARASPWERTWRGWARPRWTRRCRRGGRRRRTWRGARASRACPRDATRGGSRRRRSRASGSTAARRKATGALSLWERRALGLAQAIATGPEVLVAEAPLAGLEGDAADRVLEAVTAASEGRRALLSAARLDAGSAEGTLARGASHLVVLANGEVAIEGPPGELFGGARVYALTVRSNAQPLRAALAARGISLAGGPVRFSAALPAGASTRDILEAALAARAAVVEMVAMIG